MKKFISLFVIVTMIVACMTFTVSANDVTSTAAFIKDGTTVNKLTADINATETVLLGEGESLIVDLNGHKWTCPDIALSVAGGTSVAKVFDSSEAKTGAIIIAGNDAVKISNGELTLENITVKGGDGGMDAVIVEGGKVTLTNCTLSAGKAAINADNSSDAAGVFADITVNGGKFVAYDGAKSPRNCAIELRKYGQVGSQNYPNGPKVTLTGDITFENAKILGQDTYNKTIAEGVVAGEGATVDLSAEESATLDGRAYKVSTITYAYTAPEGGETPDAGEGETPDAGETPDNPETSDAFVVAIVTVAMIALAGVVVSKKVRA